MTFEDVWAFSGTIPDDGSFYEDEARALFRIVSGLDIQTGNILEIGCDHGRSTSILAQIARQRELRLVLIDAYGGGLHTEIDLIRNLDIVHIPYSLHCRKSADVRYDELPMFDFIHIDGGHDCDSITADCRIAYAKLRVGGLVAFHDYGTIPDVQPIVDKMMMSGWALSEIANRLAIFRRTC